MHFRSILFLSLILLSSISTFSAQTLQINQTSLTAELSGLCKQQSPDIEEARRLLSQGALMGEPDETGFSPFDWAILRGHVTLCKLFFELVESNTPPVTNEELERGQETKTDHNYREYSYIKKDSYHDCIMLVELLSKAQGSLTRTIVFLGALFEFNRHGNDRLRYLFDDIVYAHILKDVQYGIALCYAVAQDDATLVEELIKTGISLTFTFDHLTLSDETITLISRSTGSEAIRILKEAGAVVGEGLMPWHTIEFRPSHVECELPDLEIIRHYAFRKHYSLIRHCITNKQWVKSFLENERRYRYTQALNQALREGNTFLAQTLIASAAYITSPDFLGGFDDMLDYIAPAQVVVQHDNASVLKIMIEKGLNIGRKRFTHVNANNLTLLHKACISRSWDCLRLLLERGAVFNRVSSRFGHTRHCFHVLNTVDLEQFKVQLIKASIRRYVPSHEDVLEALRLLQGNLAELYRIIPQLHLTYEVIEHNEILKSAAETVFLYALNCTDASLRTLFAQHVKNEEFRATMLDLMNVLFTHIKDDPILEDYLYEQLTKEIDEIDSAVVYLQLSEGSQWKLELDEQSSKKILRAAINEKYQQTIDRIHREVTGKKAKD